MQPGCSLRFQIVAAAAVPPPAHAANPDSSLLSPLGRRLQPAGTTARCQPCGIEHPGQHPRPGAPVLAGTGAPTAALATAAAACAQPHLAPPSSRDWCSGGVLHGRRSRHRLVEAPTRLLPRWRARSSPQRSRLLSPNLPAAAHLCQHLSAAERCQPPGRVHRWSGGVPASLLLALLPAAGSCGAGCGCRSRLAPLGLCAGRAAAGTDIRGRCGGSGRRASARGHSLPAQQRAEPRAVLPQLAAAPRSRSRAGRGALPRGLRCWRRRRGAGAAGTGGTGAGAGGGPRCAIPVYLCHECHFLSAGWPLLHFSAQRAFFSPKGTAVQRRARCVPASGALGSAVRAALRAAPSVAGPALWWLQRCAGRVQGSCPPAGAPCFARLAAPPAFWAPAHFSLQYSGCTCGCLPSGCLPSGCPPALDHPTCSGVACL